VPIAISKGVSLIRPIVQEPCAPKHQALATRSVLIPYFVNHSQADADMFFLRIKIRTVAFGRSIRLTSQLAPTSPTGTRILAEKIYRRQPSMLGIVDSRFRGNGILLFINR